MAETRQRKKQRLWQWGGKRMLSEEHAVFPLFRFSFYPTVVSGREEGEWYTPSPTTLSSAEDQDGFFFPEIFS